jgi:hypothetical protein
LTEKADANEIKARRKSNAGVIIVLRKGRVQSIFTERKIYDANYMDTDKRQGTAPSQKRFTLYLSASRLSSTSSKTNQEREGFAFLTVKIRVSLDVVPSEALCLPLTRYVNLDCM